jgi:hypothetical protein
MNKTDTLCESYMDVLEVLTKLKAFQNHDQLVGFNNQLDMFIDIKIEENNVALLVLNGILRNLTNRS